MLANLIKLFFCLVLLSGCWQNPSLNLEVHLTPNKVERGKVIVQGLGACGSCHGLSPKPESALAGGQEIIDNYGSLYAANLTPSISGLGNYNLSEFIDAIRLNKSKKTEFMSGYFHRGLKKATNEDLSAIYAYLQTVTPVKNEIPKRSLSFWQKNTTGLFEERSEYIGFIPPLNNPSRAMYGKYLVDRIADCAGCHQAETPLFSEPEYLSGGKLIIRGKFQKEAPSLKSNINSNLKNWTETDFLRYLKTGRTPYGKQVDPIFCPTNFYTTAPDSELQAVANYLDTL